MIYDAIETAYTVALANFTTDLTALAVAKGITINTGVTFVKRQDAETCKDMGAPLPCCGIYGLSATTQGRDQTKRDNVNVIVFDYYAESVDPVKLAKQVDLVPEAILMSVDRLPGAGGGVYGVGEGPRSITVAWSRGYAETEESQSEVPVKPNYFRRATVTVPVWDRDTGL